MYSYIIRRLLLIIPTLFIVTIICFFSIRFLPGGAVETMVAQMGQEASGQKISVEYVEKALGLDVPAPIQYLKWISSVFRGDLGKSLWTARSINEELAVRFPVTLQLLILAMIVGIIIGIPIGTYSAVRQDTGGDYIGRSIAILFITLPTFWIGTLVIVFPSIWWNWTPPLEYVTFNKDPLRSISQMIIPAFILGASLSGVIMRITRTMMLEVLRQDYIRTAWAKGIKEHTIVLRHALKNALIPVVTVMGVQIAFMVGGSVVLEQIFGLPGLGRYLIVALGKRDYPIISAINLLIAGVILVVNLLVDLIYAYLDPRIQYK